MRVKKVNGKLYQVETEIEETINDKYKTRFFIEFLQEFGLEEKFNKCKTEDERYDIYALYTRAMLSKVHPPEYFKQNEKDTDNEVFSRKPNNKDKATLGKRLKKIKPNKKEPKETIEYDNKEEVCYKKIVIEQEQLLESFNIAIIRKTIFYTNFHLNSSSKTK